VKCSHRLKKSKTTIITAGFGYLRRLQVMRDNRVRNETLWEETDATSSVVRHLENIILRWEY
jgi:hypothetical protein